jgi:hypothetical protein
MCVFMCVCVCVCIAIVYVHMCVRVCVPICPCVRVCAYGCACLCGMFCVYPFSFPLLPLRPDPRGSAQVGSERPPWCQRAPCRYVLARCCVVRASPLLPAHNAHLCVLAHSIHALCCCSEWDGGGVDRAPIQDRRSSRQTHIEQGSETDEQSGVYPCINRVLPCYLLSHGCFAQSSACPQATITRHERWQ